MRSNGAPAYREDYVRRPQAGRIKIQKSRGTRKAAVLHRTGFDMGYLATVVILVVVGLVMVFSASYPSAYYQFGNGFHFIQRQLMWAVLGVIAMLFTANFDYHRYQKLAVPILLVSLVLLLAVPFIGVNLNGARRWLGVGGITIQPSEVAKLAIIIYFAYAMSRAQDKIKKFSELVKYWALLGICFGLLFLEPHMSACIIIGMTAVIMLLVGGARLRYFVYISLPVMVGGVAAVLLEPYRLKRLTAFLDPFQDKLGSGWQIIQSLYAIGSGGLFGLGFGNSRQKFMYVSEPQNDFIFAIICEELGLIGALVILGMFVVLIWRGIKIANEAPDTFGALLVVGITALVGVQVVLNIAVVTSSIPTTGIPLPFFSAGGSALVFLMAAMGIVLNVSRYKKAPK